MSDIHLITQLLRLTGHAMNPILLFLYCYERDFMSDIHLITQLLRLTSHAMNPILLFLFIVTRGTLCQTFT